MKKSEKEFFGAFDLVDWPKIPDADVTAVVLCHNEALRLPYFLKHHKESGIGHFLVVDNGSTDGSSDILRDDPDVTLFPSTKPYSEFKSIWRELLANHYLVGKWACFPDVDELLVHPTWQKESLPAYLARLDAHNYECLLTIMVDMYPSDEEDTNYMPGQPFLDYAPYFDAGNYRLDYYRRKKLRSELPTPAVRFRGGARERMFHKHTMHHGVPFEVRLNKYIFPLTNSFEPKWTWRLLHNVFRPFLDRMVSKPGLPNMSKVPLIRWKEGCGFRGGVHRLTKKINVSPDLGALLHFKYLSDFSERVEYNISRAQHDRGGAHYQLYSEVSQKGAKMQFHFDGTYRFDGIESLERVHLVRNVLGKHTV